MISFESKGSFDKFEAWLKKVSDSKTYSILEKYGQQGVAALSSATPIDSGETASGWYYTIEKTPTSYKIVWRNRHIVDGAPIAVLIQYGHGTGTGGFVQGRDYINPPMRVIFDNIARDARKAVNSA